MWGPIVRPAAPVNPLQRVHCLSCLTSSWALMNFWTALWYFLTPDNSVSLFCVSLSYLTVLKGTASYWTQYKPPEWQVAVLSLRNLLNHLAFSHGPDTIWQSRGESTLLTISSATQHLSKGLLDSELTVVVYFRPGPRFPHQSQKVLLL